MPGGTRTFIRLLAALMLALGMGTAAHGEVPVLTCIAPLDGTIDHRSDPARFDCVTPQTAFGPGDFGVRLNFGPIAAGPGDPLVLRTSSVWHDGAHVTFSYADGTTATLQYTSADASRYMTFGAQFEFPVPQRAAALESIFIATDNSTNWRGVLLGAKLMTSSESAASRAWMIALYAGFAGLSLALLAYNLALWVAMRHRFQLAYAAMVATLLAYAFSSSGVVMLAFPGLDSSDRFRLNYVFLALALVAGFRFVREFFGDEVFKPWLVRLSNLLSGVQLASALALAVFAPWQGKALETVYFLSGWLLLFMIFPVVWLAWRARNRYVWLFVLTWSAPILVSFTRMAHGLGLVPYNLWLDNGNLIALSIESLLSTLLIAARIRELSLDRDKARAGELAALRLANSDPLTGLMNRRAFMQATLGRKARQRLMLIDIDHFKDINDRIGHEAGDEVLRRLATAIQSVRPPESLAVRLGGEEFALLVPEARADLCSPEMVLEAVRSQEMPMEHKVTISLGYGEGSVETEAEWTRLYRLADAALYRAKADGRDRASRSTDLTRAART